MATSVEGAGVTLKVGERVIPVPLGQFLIGRHAQCNLVLEDELVSRWHARLIVSADTVVVEEVSTPNGVFVNGERLQRASALAHGDRIVVGNQLLVLCVTGALRRPSPSEITAMLRGSADKVRISSRSGSDSESYETTARHDKLALFSAMADRMLDRGEGKQAEELLSTHLVLVLDAARKGEIPAELAERASGYALVFAREAGKVSWVEYVLELYTLVRAVVPETIAKELIAAVRRGLRPKPAVYRDYLAAVNLSAEPRSLDELRRLREIEQVLATR